MFADCGRRSGGDSVGKCTCAAIIAESSNIGSDTNGLGRMSVCAILSGSGSATYVRSNKDDLREARMIGQI